jgi:ABC-2 type transport system permease protein
VTGFATLLAKELLRFWKVAFQTVGGPVLSALLFLAIFAQVLGERVRVFGEVPYTEFLVPGLVMMSVLQNAFANSSSSLIQSKVTGNLVFVLVAPISPFEFFGAYVLASAARGLVVGLAVLAVGAWFTELRVTAPLWALGFALLGAALAGVLGLLAGLWAEKFDQIAAFQSFLVVPLTLLSGVFYSIRSLPERWQTASHLNPFFYMIDGFRYGFFGAADVAPGASLAFVAVSLALLSALTLWLLQKGYKLRT